MSKYNYESKKSDYLSPPELVKKALKIKNRECFDLDTCCSQPNIPAAFYYVEGEQDGLELPWEKLNWCNPPFDECSKWIKKAYDEQQRGNETVMLIPVRTETKYWHEYILFNPNVKIQWLRKGHSFIKPEDGEPMPIFKNALALVYFNGVEKNGFKFSE